MPAKKGKGVKGPGSAPPPAPTPEPAEATESEPAASNLDDALVALQKTFSRVSTRSAGLPKSNALALITGAVNFDLKLRVDLVRDTLNLNPSGALELNLNGTLDTDIRIQDEDEGEPAARAAPAPKKKGGG
jgi:hypothetical protein